MFVGNSTQADDIVEREMIEFRVPTLKTHKRNSLRSLRIFLRQRGVCDSGKLHAILLPRGKTIFKGLETDEGVFVLKLLQVKQRNVVIFSQKN